MTQQVHTPERQALEKLIQALYWVPQTARPGELVERVNADPNAAHLAISRLGQALASAQQVLGQIDTPAPPALQRPSPHTPGAPQRLDPAQLQRLRMDAALRQLQLQSMVLGEICAAINRATPLTQHEQGGLQAVHEAQAAVANAVAALGATVETNDHA